MGSGDVDPVFASGSFPCSSASAFAAFAVAVQRWRFAAVVAVVAVVQRWCFAVAAAVVAVVQRWCFAAVALCFRFAGLLYSQMTAVSLADLDWIACFYFCRLYMRSLACCRSGLFWVGCV